MTKVSILMLGALAAVVRLVFPPLVLAQPGGGTVACSALEIDPASCSFDVSMLVMSLLAIAAVTGILYYVARLSDLRTA